MYGQAVDRYQRARKEHTCAACKRTIRKGETYHVTAEAPWQNYEGDVDEDGRSFAVLLPEPERRWYVRKVCKECDEREHEG